MSKLWRPIEMSFATLGEGWISCLACVLNRGAWVNDETDELLEVCNLSFEVAQASSDDVVIRQHADSDRISLMFLKYASCDVLSQYKISYGKLLYDNGGVNQIEWAICRLREKRESKSATIGLHRPGDSELSCLSLLDFKVRADELCLSAVYRSQNIFASQPGNVLALRQVQEYVARSLDCRAGSLVVHVMSAHIYEADIDRARRIVTAAGRGIVRGMHPIDAPHSNGRSVDTGRNREHL